MTNSELKIIDEIMGMLRHYQYLTTAERITVCAQINRLSVELAVMAAANAEANQNT